MITKWFIVKDKFGNMFRVGAPSREKLLEVVTDRCKVMKEILSDHDNDAAGA